MEDYESGCAWYMCKVCGVGFQTKFDFLTHKSQEHLKTETEISLNHSNNLNNRFISKAEPGPPVSKSEQNFKNKNEIKSDSNFNNIDNSDLFKLEPVNMTEWENSFGNEFRAIMSSAKPQEEVQNSNANTNTNTSTDTDKKKSPRKLKTVRCEKCDKMFSSVYSYRTHTKIHDGEKRFGCEECGKRFTQKINLVYHLRIHSGEKPYSCTFCTKTFAQVANLSSHIRRSHAKQN